MNRILLFLCLSLLAGNLRSQPFSNGFPFSPPPFDSSAQSFLPQFPRQAITDFVSISPDGNFAVNGETIRFWGGNLTTGACFPPKSQAPAIAARMRKMGINLMRFHHMDNPWTSSSGSIFLQNGNTTSLNAASLDRMHYLLAKMKEQGVYANINLHVSRTFRPADGVLHADSIPEFGKAVTLFDRQLIGLQKQFAQQLLGSTNPYTGLPLSSDPVMAMLEITNENTLYGFWQGNQLQSLASGGMLLQRHVDTLDQKWQAFLQAKYPSQAALQAAWNPGGTVTVPEMLQNGGFETGNAQSWQLELHNGAAATLQATTNNPFAGSHCGQVNVTQVTGTDWHLQFQQVGFTLQKDTAYTLRFMARAPAARALQVSMMRHNAPYTWYAGATFQLTPQWREFTFTFVAPETNGGQGRLSISFGNQTGLVWFDQVSLKKSVRAGLDAGEDLAAGTVRRIPYGERLNYHAQRTADMAEFYIGLQKAYYDEMYAFLKNDLGVQVPITGSNALGGVQETFSMTSLDYVDDHAYWDHPWFPNVPWSATDWQISNQAMLAQDHLGTIPDLFGGLAEQGKPYTISEYNHPTPNIYQTEMVPLLAAYSAFHGADGIMFFEYAGGDPVNWAQDRVDGFFGIHRNPAIMALFPLFAYVYREGLIRETANPLLASYSPESIYLLPQEDNTGRWGKYFPYDKHLALTTGIRTGSLQAAQASLPTAQAGGSPYFSSTGELAFRPPLGLFQVNAPRIECFAGNLGNAPQVPGNRLQVLQGSDHGVIAWASLTEQSLLQSPYSLITLASRFQNQNMIWNGTTTINNNWGSAPTAIQPLNLQVSLHILADSLRVFPLDASGAPIAAAAFTVFPQAGDRFTIDLNQQNLKSMWFGIEAFGGLTNVNAPVLADPVQVFPNPVESGGIIRIEGLKQETPFRLLSPQGQVVQRGVCRDQLVVELIARGIYYLELNQEGSRKVWKVEIQ